MQLIQDTETSTLVILILVFLIVIWIVYIKDRNRRIKAYENNEEISNLDKMYSWRVYIFFSFAIVFFSWEILKRFC